MIRRTLLAVVALAVVVPGVPAVPAQPVAAAAPKLFMVSDSVGIGAFDAIRQQFPGWQTTFVGKPGQFTETLVQQYVAPQPASVFGDVAVVATAYNYPYWDPARFDRSVDYMVNTLLSKGVKHVLWVTLRELKPQYISASAWKQALPYSFYLPTVNQRLRMALARHPSLSLIDWAAIADRPGLTYDAIHLNRYGASEYARIVFDAVTTAPTRIPGGQVRRVPVAGLGGVPPDAAGVALTITAVNPRSPAFVTVWPCSGERPWVSNLNVDAAEIASASVILPLGTDGALCTYANADLHLILDVTGVFTATSGFVPVFPRRAVDTRETGMAAPGQPLRVSTRATPGLPADASAVAINLTTIGGASPASVHVDACDRPTPPAVRFTDPGLIQNQLLVSRTDPAGDLCVTTSQPAEVIVDVFGGFAADSQITPILPTTVLDTRGGWPVAADSSVSAPLAAALGAAPTGVILTTVAVGPTDPGFVTAWPCDVARTWTSFINTLPARNRTGSALVAVGPSATICLYSSSTTHLVANVSGWTGAGFAAIAPFRALDSRYG